MMGRVLWEPCERMELGVRISAGVVGVLLVMGVVGLAGCEGLPFRSKPVECQEVGIIQFDDRMVPSEIVLERGKPARLEIMGANGLMGTKVYINALELTAGVEPGKAATIRLETSDVAKLDGETLLGEPGGPVRFVVRDGGAGSVGRATGEKVEVAVVLTEQLAAPRRITLARGVPVVLYVVKADSEVGFDNFQCDELNMKVSVQGREVQQMEWIPDRVGTFTFTGTVTPDSQVTVVVVDTKS